MEINTRRKKRETATLFPTWHDITFIFPLLLIALGEEGHNRIELMAHDFFGCEQGFHFLFAE